MEKGLDPEISWIGSYVLDEQGDPQPEQDILVWAYWYASAEHQVALSEFAWGRVLTVFLGLDMYAPFLKTSIQRIDRDYGRRWFFFVTRKTFLQI